MSSFRKKEDTAKDFYELYFVDFQRRTHESIKYLVKKNEELQERINKAIEYIRSEYTITDDDVYLTLYSSNGTLDKLEGILKGE